MKISIEGAPSFATAVCTFSTGESLYLTYGSMIAMSPGFKVAGSVGAGGLWRAALRNLIGQESFFMGSYTSVEEGCWLAIASAYPGEIVELDIGTNTWLLAPASVLASSVAVGVDPKIGTPRLLFLDEKLVRLKLSGNGIALIGSFGCLIPIDLDVGEEVSVDTGYLVGFTDSVTLKLGVVGGLGTTVITGENLIGHLTGPGKVLLQTRTLENYKKWINSTNSTE